MVFEEFFQALIRVFIILFPSYIANPIAVVCGGGIPIDLGKNWKDNRRILGDGKTWTGLLGGTFGGGFMGIILITLYGVFTSKDTIISIYGNIYFIIFYPFFVSLGGMLGDIVGSFIKRRKGLMRGEKAAGLDQWDFLIGALLFSIPFYNFFVKNFLNGYSLSSLILLFLLTPAIHRGVNILGYWLHLKKEPW